MCAELGPHAQGNGQSSPDKIMLWLSSPALPHLSGGAGIQAGIQLASQRLKSLVLLLLIAKLTVWCPW